jgi:hypothetical protein
MYSMPTSIPEHILAQIPRLAAQGKSAKEIAFLLRLDEAEIEAFLTTTANVASPKRTPED